MIFPQNTRIIIYIYVYLYVGWLLLLRVIYIETQLHCRSCSETGPANTTNY